jgi:membrane protease YdiL (CAAX protease family)
MMTHPGELLAAAIWFSLVTWLMVRTKNIWDCVIAHAITNLLLGIYVVSFSRWQLM